MPGERWIDVDLALQSATAMIGDAPLYTALITRAKTAGRRAGHAIHLNYWRDNWYFGNVRSSHGCADMRLADAEFFWNFARSVPGW